MAEGYRTDRTESSLNKAINVLTRKHPLNTSMMPVYRGERPFDAVNRAPFKPMEVLTFEEARERNRGRWHTPLRKKAEAFARQPKSRLSAIGLKPRKPLAMPPHGAVFVGEVHKTTLFKGAVDAATTPRIPGETKRRLTRDVSHYFKTKVRQGVGFPEALLGDIPNKRLSLRSTFKHNPTFKGYRKAALKSAAIVAARAVSRIAAPVALVDMIVNPIPAHGGPGYHDRNNPRKAGIWNSPAAKDDPRRRRKRTLLGIKQ